MKATRKILLHYTAIILVCVESTLYSFIIFSNNCKVYFQNGFDYQALFTWDYNPSIGMLPYKDVFYPYGILSYYKDYFLGAHLLYLFLLPVTLTTLYFCLKQVLKKTSISLVTIFAFCLFIQTFTGWEVFNRYGILVGFGIFIAYYFFISKTYKLSSLFLLGFFSGLCFSLITDTGIYCGMLFVVLLFLQPLFKRSYKGYVSFPYWVLIVKQVVIFISGFGIGSIPFVFYLVHTHSVGDFIQFSIHLSDIALYAKTPFFPSLHSGENIFVFSILFIAVFALFYRLIYTKKPFTLIHSYEGILVLIIVLLEQKSIIRSIDRTITFVGFLLLCFLLFEWLHKRNKGEVFYTSMLGFLVLIGFLLLPLLKNHTYNPSIQRIYVTSQKECREKNLVLFNSQNTVYTKVIHKVKTYPDFNGKIFSFPFDSVFYVLLHQKTPYYSNTYDSSSSIAQQKQIDFIQNQHISYILINTKEKALQDGVPEYLRVNMLLHFILSHYQVIGVVDEYLVLKKTASSVDLFTNSLAPLSYKKFLLTVDLKNIPSSEGLYHYSSLAKNPSIIFSTFAQLNRYAKNHPSDIVKSALVLFPQKTKQKSSTYMITIHRNDGVESHTNFTACVTHPCILSLSRLPLLFTRNKKYTYSFSGSFQIKKVQLFYEKGNEIW